jgi:hypothetical protein
MTKREATDFLEMILEVRRYVLDQPITYQKAQTLNTLHLMGNACQEVIAGDPPEKIGKQFLAG